MSTIKHNPCPCDSAEGIKKLQEGDDSTWEQLIRCYSRRLQRDIMASLIKRSMPDWSLQDIEQETWIIATRRIHDFKWRGRESLYHWLRVISLYRILSRLPRARLTDGTISLEEIDEPDCDSGYWFDRFLWLNMLVQENPENELILQEERTALVKLLLSDEHPTHIEIALKRWVEGKAPRELARAYGMEPKTISQILWSLKKRLETLDRFLNTGFVEHPT